MAKPMLSSLTLCLLHPWVTVYFGVSLFDDALAFKWLL